jgi:hypothetical protein
MIAPQDKDITFWSKELSSCANDPLFEHCRQLSCHNFVSCLFKFCLSYVYNIWRRCLCLYAGTYKMQFFIRLLINTTCNSRQTIPKHLASYEQTLPREQTSSLNMTIASALKFTAPKPSGVDIGSREFFIAIKAPILQTIRDSTCDSSAWNALSHEEKERR